MGKDCKKLLWLMRPKRKLDYCRYRWRCNSQIDFGDGKPKLHLQLDEALGVSALFSKRCPFKEIVFLLLR